MSILTGLFYLNNHGSRWVVFDETGRHEQISLTTKSGKKVTRRVIYYEMCGNFGVACISYKGKKIIVEPETILED